MGDFLVNNADFLRAHCELVKKGATYLPNILNPDPAAGLLEMMRTRRDWTTREPVKNGVVQDRMEAIEGNLGSEVGWFAEELEQYLLRGFDGLIGQPLRGLRFNELSFQRFLPGSRGIGSHRDSARYTGLIAVATLAGSGNFEVVDHANQRLHVISAKPLSIILMRATGFDGDDLERPRHRVTQISKRGRDTINFRQLAANL